MARSLPQCVDTVIIGNGPSALILSYILHGHVPYYIGGHHDPILHAKLEKSPNLLHLTPDLYAHFLSSLRYSTQALPVNTLLDTLIRPNADTELNPTSCIEWRYEPQRAVSHVAIGDTEHAGGQWAENPVSASADIGTLSYAEQLSLPGYSYADHLAKSEKQDESDFVRPSRTEVADYLRAYPQAVGIADAVYTGVRLENVYRTGDGFVVGSLGMRCKHLVLASGIFTVNIPPPPSLAPVAQLDSKQEPLLVIGSGFSAADVIISAPPTRRIIHIFQWAPEKRPSPLRGCHHTAYPEYATVYRQMKLAAIASMKSRVVKSPLLRRKSNPFFEKRDWNLYEGLPNAEIINVSASENTGSATLTVRLVSGEEITRKVGGLAYVVGRRGTLKFLSRGLQDEIMTITEPNTTSASSPTLISGRTLRTKAEGSLEVAKNVFITGSLTGDSLIRHSVGGCVFTAGRILGEIPTKYSPDATPSPATSTPRSPSPVSDTSSGRASFDGADATPNKPKTGRSTTGELTNGHADLHLDRRKLANAVEVAHAENRLWAESGWWAGGLGPGRFDA
ncbi:Nn.00g008340.m01.CDS01 [Neocucurbitaria sp. VM-36]